MTLGATNDSVLVDQRPSGIDLEVASQLGTRLTALLSEENDIGAVFSGVGGGGGAAHGAGQPGHQEAGGDPEARAAPMPGVIRVREDDEAFFAAMGGRDTGAGARAAALAGAGAGRGAAGLLEAFGLE